ncbi:hypothetical protein LCGC14_2403530 [marine sediment metagenome]|uniref:Uncharacterized protein n=1 Tax=marine sediment metagenome TaxID=412755 RepID=A0A0F9BUS4_9ZZZZ
MPGVLQKIPKIHPQLIPPQGAVQRGTTPDGKQLWYMEIPMSRSVKDILPGTKTRENPEGEQRYRMNPAGEKVYKLYVSERYIWKRLFFLESEGNGNVAMVPYVPQTDAQIAATERARKVAAMKDSMAEAFVDAGVLPENLVATLRAGQVQVPVEVEEPETVGPAVEVTEEEVVAEEPKAKPEAEKPPASEDSITYPHMYGPGWWRLSNGERVRGDRKKAERAEKDVLKARAAAKETPDY